MFSFGLIFMTGIISDALFSIPSSIILGVVAILAVAFLALEFQIKKTKRRQYALLGLLFVFTIFVTGVFSNSLRSSLKKKIDDPSGDLLLIELKEEAKPVPTPVITAQPIVDEPVAPNLAVPPIEKPVVLAPLVPEIPSPDLKPEPVPNKTPVPSETAAASSSDGEGDSEVVEQEVVRRPSKTQFEKPPEGNDLSRSLYMERAGKKDVARRLRARAITKEGYSNNFEIVRTVLEDQVASALESSDCDGAGSVLDNAKNAFPKDPSVDRWMAQMRNRIRRQCKID